MAFTELLTPRLNTPPMPEPASAAEAEPNVSAITTANTVNFLLEKRARRTVFIMVLLSWLLSGVVLFLKGCGLDILFIFSSLASRYLPSKRSAALLAVHLRDHLSFSSSFTLSDNPLALLGHNKPIKKRTQKPSAQLA
jgi:hypothetical protein